MTDNYKNAGRSSPLEKLINLALSPLRDGALQVGGVLGVAAINAGLKPVLIETDELSFFDGKTLRLCIRDWDMNLDFGYQSGKIKQIKVTSVDVTFSGYSTDFINLARQRIDPDTLFFQRRLVAKGDMALAVGLKNTLLGLDRTEQPTPFIRLLDILGDVLEALDYARSRCVSR